MQFPKGIPLQGILQHVLFSENWHVLSNSHPQIIQNGIIRYYAHMSSLLTRVVQDKIKICGDHHFLFYLIVLQ